MPEQDPLLLAAVAAAARHARTHKSVAQLLLEWCLKFGFLE